MRHGWIIKSRVFSPFQVKDSKQPTRCQSYSSFFFESFGISDAGVGPARSWGLPWGGVTFQLLGHCLYCPLCGSYMSSTVLYTSPAPPAVWWGSSRPRERPCPLARHSDGVIPLSIHSWAWVLCWSHSHLQNLVRAESLVDWKGKTVCRKLALDVSLGVGAVCPYRGCLMLDSCTLRSSCAIMRRLMRRGGGEGGRKGNAGQCMDARDWCCR